MSTPVVANVIHTGAVLWVAPVGEAIPDETTVDYGDAWGGNWVRVGYTKAPLAAAYESEEHAITVEEVLAAIARRRIGEGLTLETVLAELAAEYLQLAASNQTAISEVAAGAGQDAYEETGLGGVSILTEKKWGFEGLFYNASSESQPIRLFVHKATAKINGPLEFSKKATDTPGISIQIAALADTTQTAGKELCLYQRVTAEKTS
jgi:hypothetical protein